jgi:hypothetical protein
MKRKSRRELEEDMRKLEKIMGEYLEYHPLGRLLRDVSDREKEEIAKKFRIKPEVLAIKDQEEKKRKLIAILIAKSRSKTGRRIKKAINSLIQRFPEVSSILKSTEPMGLSRGWQETAEMIELSRSQAYILECNKDKINEADDEELAGLVAHEALHHHPKFRDNMGIMRIRRGYEDRARVGTARDLLINHYLVNKKGFKLPGWMLIPDKEGNYNAPGKKVNVEGKRAEEVYEELPPMEIHRKLPSVYNGTKMKKGKEIFDKIRAIPDIVEKMKEIIKMKEDEFNALHYYGYYGSLDEKSKEDKKDSMELIDLIELRTLTAEIKEFFLARLSDLPEYEEPLKETLRGWKLDSLLKQMESSKI